MKKSLVLVGAFLAFAGLSYAGTPQDQGAQLSGKFFHTQLYGSTGTTTNTYAPTVTIATITTNSGGQTVQFQNCFTRFIVQLTTGAVFNLYDGATTTAPIMTLYGQQLGSAPGNTISIPEDHLGPLCLSLNTPTNIVISTGSVAGVTGNSSVFYEGYTSAGPGSASN